jgi:hypothetical protein
VGYRLVDGRLDWLRWSGRDAVGEPASSRCFTTFVACAGAFLLNNNRIDAWPPGRQRRQPAARRDHP